ncbi:CAAX protease [Vibrio galatheae]|uniref:CAAX protease n=1 Tax=Vibrio galatheae TaxID=579748 RepID=A0A0F4NQW2_9VIBR|nr:CPBP family intramembrane glutamic endopeptidase [Vibrio galatheae]KJY85248.1 CAAX protease [Vibrio galatheae]
MHIDHSIWVWLLLSASILAAFLRAYTASLSLLAATLLGGFIASVLSPQGLIIVVTFLAGTYYLKDKPSLPPVILSTVIIIGSLALFLHLVPGFSNPQVLQNVQTGPLSANFNMYLNLDKPLAFFALLLAFPALLGESCKVNYRSVLLISIPLFALLPIASLLGAIKPEFSLPNWWWLFAFNNLLFTCVAEEALFRGFIQQKLTNKYGAYIGVVVASLLFALAHFAGGPLLIVFASLAGLGYGLIFLTTGRLWAAVLVHFLFNFSHLLFYTYPTLRG